MAFPDGTYGVIHRSQAMAASHGILRGILAFCEEKPVICG